MAKARLQQVDEPVWRRERKVAAKRIVASAICDPGLVEVLGIDPKEIPDPELREFYAWICEKKPQDQLAVMTESGFSPSVLNALVDSFWSPAGSLDSYVDRLREANRRERMILVVSDSARQIERGEDVDEVLTGIALADDVTHGVNPEVFKSDKVFKETAEQIEKVQSGEVPGFVSTGFQRLDAFAPAPGSQITIGAATTTGKTELALSILDNAARSGLPGLFFSLEMTLNECAARIISRATRIDSTLFRYEGALKAEDWDLFGEAVDVGKGLPLYWSTAERLDRIIATATRLHRRAGIRIMAVDYLQLVGIPKGERRDLEVGTATRAFLRLAKKTGMVVYLLSQLNRKVDFRGDKRPRLSDLRDSGAIEQDTDSCWLLDRDTPDGEDMRILIAKARNGRGGIVTLKFRNGHIWEE